MSILAAHWPDFVAGIMEQDLYDRSQELHVFDFKCVMITNVSVMQEIQIQQSEEYPRGL